MVTTIIELFLVSSAVAVAGVAVIWWLSRLVASFLEDLDGPPIDDSEGARGIAEGDISAESINKRR